MTRMRYGHQSKDYGLVSRCVESIGARNKDAAKSESDTPTPLQAKERKNQEEPDQTHKQETRHDADPHAQDKFRQRAQ